MALVLWLLISGRPWARQRGGNDVIGKIAGVIHDEANTLEKRSWKRRVRREEPAVSAHPRESGLCFTDNGSSKHVVQLNSVVKSNNADNEAQLLRSFIHSSLERDTMRRIVHIGEIHPLRCRLGTIPGLTQLYVSPRS